MTLFFNSTLRHKKHNLLSMRKWHRWISIPAIVFLLVVSVSGLVLQVKGFLNEDEEKAEQIESQKSKVSLNSSLELATKFGLAKKAILSKYGNIDIKKVEIELRQSPAIISLYTDEDKPRVIQIDADTFQFISEKPDNTDTFWIKLHSGELLGDAGRSVGIFSGLALLFLTISGCWIYFQMYQRRPKNSPLWKRVFW